MTHYLERIISSNKDLPHIVVKLPIPLETEEKIEEKTIVFNVPTHIIEVATHYPVKYLLHLMHCVTMCKGKLVLDEDSSPCDDAQLRQRWHAPDQLSWPKVRFIAEGQYHLHYSDILFKYEFQAPLHSSILPAAMTELPLAHSPPQKNCTKRLSRKEMGSGVSSLEESPVSTWAAFWTKPI
ncbi:hypothetical protein VKT23_012044 [Stygiomarasmius scandens]|uniref:Uncharacterized protein n=1 Tax=Marasmiellus scandens TaxID=2682957 RepID=A0ABR1JA50_9AGAR